MYIPFSKLFEGVKLFVIFVVTTFIFFSIISFFADVIKPSNPYKKPEGRAIKVMKTEDHFFAVEGNEFIDRLKFFYWLGE